MNLVFKTSLSGLILLGVSACAVSPDSQRTVRADIDTVEDGVLQPEPVYVTVTGSRIRHRLNEDGSAPMTSAPIVGYSQDDIQFSGARVMQSALIILDPRID